jgi:hypothetical protein
MINWTEARVSLQDRAICNRFSQVTLNPLSEYWGCKLGDGTTSRTLENNDSSLRKSEAVYMKFDDISIMVKIYLEI